MEKENPEILLEDIRGKFDLVLEGHQVLHKQIQVSEQKLTERINLVDFKVEALNQKVDNVEIRLSQKIDDVAEDLKAHRADTEAHKELYRVKEPE
jgi:hypothetical protein